MEILSIVSILFSIVSSLFVYDEWEYVGKQEVDPTAESIPLVPPVGKPYILFKQVCENGPKNST